MRAYTVRTLEGSPILDVEPETYKHFFFSYTTGLGLGVKYDLPWLPLKLSRLKIARYRKLRKPCDLAFIRASMRMPVFSTRAKKIFEPFLGDQAQWLPLDFDECEYWLVNILTIIDLDGLRSETDKPGLTPDIRDVRRYAFRPECLGERLLFKCRPGLQTVLCTDRTRKLVEAEKLTGFSFDRVVWDSELEPFSLVPDLEEVRQRFDAYGPSGPCPYHGGRIKEWKPAFEAYEEEQKKLRRLARKKAK